jgi:hypothetical protein
LSRYEGDVVAELRKSAAKLSTYSSEVPHIPAKARPIGIVDPPDADTAIKLARMWPISTRVNKPENDDPSILEPTAVLVA